MENNFDIFNLSLDNFKTEEKKTKSGSDLYNSASAAANTTSTTYASYTSVTVPAGTYVIVECWIILDPDVFTNVYNDMFLKRYATAQIKKQWGNNLKKFAGVQLPGGVTLNGEIIYQEATEEIRQIETEIQSRFELPVDMFVG